MAVEFFFDIGCITGVECIFWRAALAKNQTYRAFVEHPSHVLDLNGELLDSAPVMAELASEVRDISAYATYVVRNDEALGGELSRVTVTVPAEAGRQAGVTMPNFLVSGRTGRSRKERLLCYNAVTSCRSWRERDKAANGESSKYVSQGWKRTANGPAPSYGEDYVNLGAVDRAYASIENDPFADGEIILRMVIQVDVGINAYAAVVVRDTKTGRVVYKTTLSQRVHSLWNSVQASQYQVRALRRKAKTLLRDRQARMSALDEAKFHRESASRKKRELAILAAQEIAYLSHVWGNAVVAVEDLSWIRNTMQNGRWNRGALVQWLTHYVSKNGGWVVAVNPANTSQKCHKCGAKVSHPTHKLSSCPEHGTMDRDVNAAANIAAKAVPRVVKARATRAKNRKLQPQVPLRTPPARASLKYPGRDRTKNKPTPKRKNHRRAVREVILPVCPARAQATRLEASVLAD